MFANEKELLEQMTRPSQRLVEDVAKIQGDIMILGAGGKVGPSLAITTKRACDMANVNKRVVAVSLFDYPDAKSSMEEWGVEVLEKDLFSDDERAQLPQMENIIYMVGRKFGTTQNQEQTWAVNVLLASKICETFPHSRIVSFSTGNVYGDIPANSGGSTEEDELNPDGEYGQSCLGRERVMEYYSKKNNTPMLQFRLNYAVALRYGVLYDIANAVNSGEPVSLGRSIFNCIWQGDVCEYAIRSLLHTAVPPVKLNVTGPETISTKWAAEEFGRLLGKTPVFSQSEPAPGGVFSNSSKMVEWMGYPQTSLRQMMRMQADWIKAGQSSIHAPTHFETVDGKY